MDKTKLVNSSNQDTLDKIIALLKKNKVDDYEVSINKSTNSTVLVRKTNIETLSQFSEQSVGINIAFGKRKTFVSTVDLSYESLKHTISAGCVITKKIQSDPFFSLAPKDKMAWQLVDLDMYYSWNISQLKIIDLAKFCEATALDCKGITNSEGCEISTTNAQTIYANSHNFSADFNYSNYSISCVVIAGKDNNMQVAYDYDAVIDPKDFKSVTLIGEKSAKLALDKLNPTTLSSRKCPVIFDANTSAGFFSILLKSLSGSNQYRKNTFLLNSIGKKVLPDFVDIYENPLQKKTIGARSFDSDGVKTQMKYFIKDGVIKNFLLSQYSANQLGLETTGNAGGVHNCLVKDKNSSYKLEHLIKKMDTGLLITELMGDGVNMATGDYSRGATGFWVENGKIQYPVAKITIAGNMIDMLKNILAIGDDFEVKNNIKSGSVLIEKMTIAGS